VATLRIGGPLKGGLKSTVDSNAQGQRVLYTLVDFHDAGGRKVYFQYWGQGKPHRITIKDQAGKELTSGLVLYGDPRSLGVHSWPVPDGVKGTLTVELETDKLPVQVDCPPVKVEIK
jgi:hypothetical protein